jgi:hypothetical protein
MTMRGPCCSSELRTSLLDHPGGRLERGASPRESRTTPSVCRRAELDEDAWFDPNDLPFIVVESLALTVEDVLADRSGQYRADEQRASATPTASQQRPRETATEGSST